MTFYINNTVVSALKHTYTYNRLDQTKYDCILCALEVCALL